MGEWPRTYFNILGPRSSDCKATYPVHRSGSIVRQFYQAVLPSNNIMGGSSSKEQETKQEVATEIDQSSGFHLLEIHLPTAGMGIGLILILIMIFCCCFPIVRRSMQLWKRLQRVENSGQPNHQAPQIVVLGGQARHLMHHAPPPACVPHGVADIQPAEDSDTEAAARASASAFSMNTPTKSQVHWGPA